MTTKPTDPRLPRRDDAEEYLVQCVAAWPENANEVVPLLKPTDFFTPHYQKLWRVFTRQLAFGSIDLVAAARECDCAYELYELRLDAVTAVHVESRVELVKNAAKARALYEVCQRAADALLRGRSADSVLASLSMALGGFHEAANT